MRTLWLTPAVLVVLVSVTAPARADIDNDKADQLFLEGRDLLKRGETAAACKKFEQALGYNPQSLATHTNLALCHEQLGNVATAVEYFREVVDRATEQQADDFKKVAEDHLVALEPELSFATITFAEPPLPETKVVIDDRLVPADRLVKLPIDPGERTLVVTAPGRVAYRKVVTVTRRQTLTIEVPPLGKSVIKSSRRTIGVITLAAGGGTLVTGVVLGLVARGRYDEVVGEGKPCMTSRVCDTPEAFDQARSAKRLGTVGTVVGTIGVVGIGIGAFLWWRSPRAAEERKVSVLPHLDGNSAGLTAIGRF